jgi:hypothetical protein
MCHLAIADSVVKPGIDAFTTVGRGFTYYSFTKNPIPAGFFCDSSETFTGRVALRGLPLETGIPGQLKTTDTIIERLDEAVFDAQGVAKTRIRFRALSMVSIAPIKTSCGDFHVYVTLDGQQPVTRMRIVRSQPDGGTFRAPLAAKVRLTFVPVQGTDPRRLELKGSVIFPGKPIPWTFADGKALTQLGSAVVDTNGDLRPDTRLPGMSNFMAGYLPQGPRPTKLGGCVCTCHFDGGEEHCTAGWQCPEVNCYP